MAMLNNQMVDGMFHVQPYPAHSVRGDRHCSDAYRLSAGASRRLAITTSRREASKILEWWLGFR